MKRRHVDKPYATWTYDERMILINTRIKYNNLFTSKNANMSTGWRKVVDECGTKLGPDKNYINCKQQWMSLMRKYKSFIKLNTGNGAADDVPPQEQEREEWPFFDVIHNYASKKDNYHPPYLLSSSEGVIVNRNETDVSQDETQASTSSSFQSFTGRNESPVSNLRSKEQDYLKAREKRDKRIEKKINGLLGVFGQMVKTDYPNINVDSLLISSGDSDDSN